MHKCFKYKKHQNHILNVINKFLAEKSNTSDSEAQRSVFMYLCMGYEKSARPRNVIPFRQAIIYYFFSMHLKIYFGFFFTSKICAFKYIVIFFD